MLEAAKFKIQDIASQGKPVDDVRDELLGQLETVYANTPKDDWADNIFLGVAYFLLGDKSRGMDCIAVNLDFEYEQKVSGMLFAQMEKLAENGRNPVVFHALSLLEQSKGSAGDYARVMKYLKKHDALKGKAAGAYSEIVPLVRKYADEGREAAKILLADMLMYGLGVKQDTGKAEGMFSELAEKGNVYAQFMMVQRYAASQKYAPQQKTGRSAKKKYTPQELEALYQEGGKWYYGRNVRQNWTKAVEYYAPAAEDGHVQAQYSLGICYRLGYYGVSQDLEKARYWFQKAAAQGHEPAKRTLENLNANGR